MSENVKYTMAENRTIQTESTGKGIQLGSHNVIDIHFRLHKAASGTSNIQFEHSAVDENDAYINLGTPISLTTLGETFQSQTNFLDFVRWRADGSVSSDPVVTIYIVGKDA